MNAIFLALASATALLVAAHGISPSKGETMPSSRVSSFADVLHSGGPAPDRGGKMNL